MATRFYPAILEPDGRGGYGVVFPDLPGCVSAGRDAEEAARHAVEALVLHVEGLIEAGASLPEPSAVDAPLPDWLASEGREGCPRVLVPVELETRPVRVNVMIEEGLLARIDRVAELRGMTRSAFLAEAARRALAGEAA